MSEIQESASEAPKPPGFWRKYNGPLKAAAIVVGLGLYYIWFHILPGAWWPSDVEIVGEVKTVNGAPVEGAFVVLSLNGFASAFLVGNATWCVKTLGTHTNKEGKYRFVLSNVEYPPSPWQVDAIKSGYFLDYSWYPHLRFNKKTFGLHPTKFGHLQYEVPVDDIILIEQNPEKPDWHLGGPCGGREHIQYREDAEAIIQFFRIKIDETIRFDPTDLRRIENEKSIIQDFEKLPRRQK